MPPERGSASVEWVALVAILAVALGAAIAVGPRVDGRSFGSWLAHNLLCAAQGGCDRGDDHLADAYGEATARLVREHAPNVAYEPRTLTLPVDWRSCRSHRCSDAPDRAGLDAHRSRSGRRATVFTRVIRRGRTTYLQYWLYYPDSTTTVAGVRRLWGLSPAARLGTWIATGETSYPGYHRDDWEGYQVRIRAGRTDSRATSHGHWQHCIRGCRDRWGPSTGWTRVSYGSHSGHIPGGDAGERTSSAPGLVLVPLEAIDRGRYRRLDDDISPPWDKEPWDDPESGES